MDADAILAGVFAKVLADPDDVEALENLAMTAARAGKLDAALTAITRAVELEPHSGPLTANLAHILHDRGEFRKAELAYEHALALNNAPAVHEGAAYTAERLGLFDKAEHHRRQAFSHRAVTTIVSDAEPSGGHVVLAVSARGGNTDFHRALFHSKARITKIVVDFFQGSALPRCDVVICAPSDPDRAAKAIARLESLLRHPAAGRIINHPAAVRATSRERLPKTLAGIDGLIVPHTTALTRQALETLTDGTALQGRSFTFPLLLRAPGYHTGIHAVRVNDAAAMRDALAAMPSDDVYVLNWHDVRSTDGLFRKYRVIMIDGRWHPLHLAIAKQPIVHDNISITANVPELMAQEAAFLQNPREALGEAAAHCLDRATERLNLDFGGIDFSFDRSGTMIVFEANATMIIADVADDARRSYRKSVVDRLQAAQGRMLRVETPRCEMQGQPARRSDTPLTP